MGLQGVIVVGVCYEAQGKAVYAVREIVGLCGQRAPPQIRARASDGVCALRVLAKDVPGIWRRSRGAASYAFLGLFLVVAAESVVPLIGLALNYTPFGLRLVPVLVGLSVFTILLALAASVRRQGLPEEERFVVDVQGMTDGRDVKENGFYYREL